MKLPFDEGNHRAGGDGAPDLRFRGILAAARNSINALLLDPLDIQVDRQQLL